MALNSRLKSMTIKSGFYTLCFEKRLDFYYFMRTNYAICNFTCFTKTKSIKFKTES